MLIFSKAMMRRYPTAQCVPIARIFNFTPFYAKRCGIRTLNILVRNQHKERVTLHNEENYNPKKL